MPIDLRNYPPNWREISSRIRFVRAKYMCECRGECGTDHSDMDSSDAFSGWCRSENAEPEKGRCTAVHLKGHPTTGTKVVLTVAHLDHNPDSDDETRMLAFCQGCHLRYDTQQHALTRRRNRALRNQVGTIPFDFDQEAAP